MKSLKIGVMPREQFQRRAILIASGKLKPKKGEPKIWFSSIKSLSQVLSDKNMMLLELIYDKKPETLTQLAELSGRQTGNLSRTLKTMERYGIVELQKKSHALKPIAKAKKFDISYELSAM
jgi:predicted transcriptional regulator